MAADPRPPDITLEQFYGGKPTDIGWQLDEGFVKRQEAIEQAEWMAALGGGPGGEQAGAPTAEGPPPQPSAIVEGVKSAGAAFVEGGKLAATGIEEALLGGRGGQVDVMGRGLEGGGGMPALKKIFDGLMGMGLSPFVGLGTAGGQALENYDPGVAATEFTRGQEALNYRAFLAMRAQSSLTPEERQAMSQPMSVREALETAIQIAAPLAAGPAVKGGKKVAGKAVEINKAIGERGALGKPPEPPPGSVRLYHGSQASFEKFDPERASRTGLGEKGVYFTADPKEASGYSQLPSNAPVEAPGAQVQFIDVPKNKLVDLANPPEGIPKTGNADAAIKAKGYLGFFNSKTGEYVIYEPEALRAGAAPPTAGGPGGAEPPRKPPTAAERLAGEFEPEPRANMARVGAPEDIKALIADMDVTAQKAGLIKLERITHEQTAAGAKAKEMTIKRAFDLVNSWESLHENATAIRDLRDHMFTQLKALELEANSGDPRAVAKAENAAVITGVMEEIAVKAGEHMGRGLSSFSIMSEAARAYGTPGALSEMLANWKAGMLPGDSLIARLGQLRSKAQKQVFLRQLVGGYIRGQNVFYEAWINGLLSNPISHGANIASNALVAAWGISERQMAGMMNVILTHDPEGVRIGEAAIMLRAAITAQKKSSLVAWKVFREGKDVFGSGKMEVAPSLTAERMGLNPENPLSGAVDFTGAGIRLPSRLMMTEDAYFKWLNYTMDMEARAWREAGMRGLRGDAKAEFIRDFLEAPDPARRAPSEDFASMQTFTRQFTRDSLSGRIGEVGQLVQRLPMGRLLFPFMVTPVNVSGWAWRRTPGLAFLSESLYRDMFERKGAARDLALARLGTSAMLAGAYMEFSAAGLVTGAGVEKGDAKDALKALGRQDYAVRVGDDLYRINRLSPPGMMIGAMASFAEIAGQLPENRRLELGVALAMVMAEGIKDQPFYQQLNHVMQAVQNPSSMTKNFIESNVRTLIPYSGLLHQVKKTGIPGLIEPDPHRRIASALTEWEQLKNMYIADLPNYSTRLPSKKNQITGDPIVLPPGFGWDMVSPVTVTQLHGDPVFESILRNRPSLPDFPEAIPGKLPPALQMDAQKAETAQALPLTAEEIDQGVRIQTREIVIDGKNLYQTLRELVTKPEFLAKEPGEGGGQAPEIEKVYRKFREEAIKEFRRRNPAIDKDITDIIEQRTIRRRGSPDKPMPPVQIAPGMLLPGAR